MKRSCKQPESGSLVPTSRLLGWKLLTERSIVMLLGRGGQLRLRKLRLGNYQTLTAHGAPGRGQTKHGLMNGGRGTGLGCTRGSLHCKATENKSSFLLLTPTLRQSSKNPEISRFFSSVSVSAICSVPRLQGSQPNTAAAQAREKTSATGLGV